MIKILIALKQSLKWDNTTPNDVLPFSAFSNFVREAEESECKCKCCAAYQPKWYIY